MSLFGFEQDANTILCGPIASGKTTLLIDILVHGTFIPSPEQNSSTQPEQVLVLCSPETVKSYKEKEKLKDVKLPLSFIAGVENCFEYIKQLATNDITNAILIIDDLDTYLKKDKYQEAITQLFNVTTHHKHLWTFLVTHEVFSPGAVSLRRNTQNFILFNLLQDSVAANTYLGKLVGKENLDIFMSCWKYCLDHPPPDRPQGWIRLDIRLRGPSHRILTGNGLSPEAGTLFYAEQNSVTDTSVFD